jgi:toxin ParE1/3/4
VVRVDWAQPAIADLRQVYDFIAQDSPRYAQLTIEKITAVAESLGRFPQLGEVLPEFPERDYRQIVVGAYRLIYREDPQQGRVLVVAVIHGSRDLPPALDDR